LVSELIQVHYFNSNRTVKNKTKQNKPWHDDECKVKLRHVKILDRLLNKSPWQRGLRYKVLFEKKQYNKLLRKKYRAFKVKLLNNLLDTINI
jgi:hypothetical protein